ncbi:MAG: hypothetical protein ACI9EF_002857 [Pseudohongiellaceae bacterium]|jgi:hypothetical protein
MKIYFCDGCNESVPLLDVQSGQITTIKGKLFCKTCIPPSAMVTPLTSPAPAAKSSGQPVLLLLVILLLGWTAWRDRDVLLGRVEEPLEQAGPSPVVELRQQSDALETELIYLRDESEGHGRRLTDFAAGQDSLAAADGALSQRLDGHADAMVRLTRSQVAAGQLIEKVQRNTNGQATLEMRIEALSAALSAQQDTLDFGVASLGDVIGIGGQPLEVTEPAAPAVDPERVAAMDEIRRLLLDPEPDLRFEGVDRLETSGFRELAQDLVALLADEDMFVRLHAMNVLGNFGHEGAIPALFDVLDDGNASIRKTAAETLVRLTGYDPGFEHKGSSGERSRAIRKWRDWYSERGA